MANSKRQCCGCKSRFRVETMIEKPIGMFCTLDCMISYAIKPPADNAQKVRNIEKKEDNLRKKVFYANDLKTMKDKAQTAFNAYIRLRDIKEPCISCQRHHTGQYHAGHYKTVGAHSELRFTEDNCHKQCAPCNNHLSGNIENYRPNLIKKIGRERFDRLTDYQKGEKWTCDMYRGIEFIYKEKLKQLEGE